VCLRAALPPVHHNNKFLYSGRTASSACLPAAAADGGMVES